MKCETISDAAHRWVGEFNAIPQILIAKLIKLDPDEVYEITPPGSGDQVYIMFGEYEGKYLHRINAPSAMQRLRLTMLNRYLQPPCRNSHISNPILQNCELRHQTLMQREVCCLPKYSGWRIAAVKSIS